MKNAVTCLTFLALGALGQTHAKSHDGSRSVWILEFDRPGMAAEKMRRLGPIRPSNLDPDYANDPLELKRLAADQDLELKQLSQAVGRPLPPLMRFNVAGNGVAIELSPAEAAMLTDQSSIRTLEPERLYQLHTDAGPDWIQAPQIWATGNLGQGVVVGVLDGAAQSTHPAFADIGGDGYDHDNPTGQQFGLCGSSGITCNDKLIGVYNFTDEPIGPLQNNAHGTHVASTAVGNVREATLNGQTVTISGVAPHANLISYKVCRDPEGDDQGGCPTSAILAALDQAILDGVDVINMSLGGPESNPWFDTFSQRTLAVREAGILPVTSAGNSGPNPSTLGSPGADPWTLSVASITHHRGTAKELQELSGGDTQPPLDVAGGGQNGAFGPAQIVHARDFGNALCGAGTAELQGSCDAHTGSTNPFPAGTFNGEIVVCDRGIYGRIEKSFNVRAAGASGFILANTAAQGEQISSDVHCVPGVHLGRRAGDALRAWLGSGDGHSGSISDPTPGLFPAFGDNLNGFSSRGPSRFATDQVKPDVAAPGSAIFAAYPSGNGFLSGTSMASPHVAGLVALLISERPELTPGELHSIVVGTARNDEMDAQGRLAHVFDVGAGRARADLAIRSGLALFTPQGMFDRGTGGASAIPLREMNLPGLVDNSCRGTCSFTRTLTDIAGGGRWMVSTEGPLRTDLDEFTLADDESVEIEIQVDIAGEGVLGDWNDGAVIFTSADNSHSSFRLPARIFGSVGPVPNQLAVTTPQLRGSTSLNFTELIALPNIGYRTTGLARTQSESPSTAADNTNDDPFDSEQGTIRRFFQILPGGALIVETEQGTSSDIDLFVGRDSNDDGNPSLNEELCRSTSPNSEERCELTDLAAGSYWVVVQNWQSNNDSDQLNFGVTAIDADDGSLVVTGPRQTEQDGEDFSARVTWDIPDLAAQESHFGYIYLTAGEAEQVVGTVPVSIFGLQRAGGTSVDLEAQQPLMLLDGVAQSLRLEPNEGHGRLFIDLPAATSAVDVNVEANAPIRLQVVSNAMSFVPPQVSLADTAGATASTGERFSQQLSFASQDNARRVYIVPVNESAQPVDITVSASQTSAQTAISGSFIQPLQGLYFNPERDGAGINLNYAADGSLALQWYTYLEDGSPTWYLANGQFLTGRDQWTGALSFFNYDGTQAQQNDAGDIVLTWLNETEFVVSFNLNGQSGSERYRSLTPDFSCETVGPRAETTGLWFLAAQPGFGYSVLSLADRQIQIDYLYDSQGFPRWVLGQGEHNSPITVSQFSGFCPTCEVAPVNSEPVGSNQLELSSPEMGSAESSIDFLPPLNGRWRSAGEATNLISSTRCSS